MPEENKTKFPLWLYPTTREQIIEWSPKDNCKSQSEFIEKAVLFYIGYLSAQNRNEFLPLALTSAMEGTVAGLENRITRLLFKLAVETSMTMSIIGKKLDVSEMDLTALRGKCVKDVKQSNGSLTLDNVIAQYQGRR